ncbi:MAG: potassium channel family protein [Deltaproteobacteria bacterium]
MFVQIILGSSLILATVVISGASYLVMETLFMRFHNWLVRRPHAPKQMLVLCVAALWILMLVTIAVWIWAAAFRLLGIFPTLEASVYFALVSYTTLGFGDVLLPQDWRLLSGMLAANGLLNIGMSTAILIEVMRQLRVNQSEAVTNDSL